MNTVNKRVMNTEQKTSAALYAGRDRMRNAFFDFRKLKHLGKNVIIGEHVRIRRPEHVVLGDYSIIDDFTYISTRLTIGRFVHIASNTVMVGGEGECIYEDFAGSSPGCTLITCSDDFVGGLACPQIPRRYKGNAVVGKVHLKKHALLGTASVVFPNVTLEEGAATGAMTLVPRDLKPWSLYIGSPARFLKRREKGKIERLAAKFLKEYSRNGEIIS
jgi:galactoside O-acetyltransferase